MIDLVAQGIEARFDPSIGMLVSFEVARGGARAAPLHRAPWVGREEMPEGTAPHLSRLGGDFLCAPFGMGDPLHGPPANAPWQVTGRGEGWVSAVLSENVQGARIEKTVALRDGHPFVYQSHRLTGGQGALPLANHACVSVAGGAHVRTSPKSSWRTPPEPLEGDPARGRSALAYPARAADPVAFPGADGPIDIRRVPWGLAEDFVSGIEAGAGLGWTAISRPADLYLSLRDAGRLPMTMLWHSNGGRDYAPWSGRHMGCLGVEEGAAPHMLGADGGGVAPVALGGDLEIRHVIGAIPWPTGAPVASVVLAGAVLTVTGEDGTTARLPIAEGVLPEG